MKNLIPAEIIERRIYLIRGQRVMLDSDLAKLYGVKTKVLIQAVKRNIARFPSDFMFQLTKSEIENLRSQFVTSSWGGRRYLPYVFTEQGVAQLSTVLNSERAIMVNIGIIRTFVRLRQVLATHEKFAEKLAKLEHRIAQNEIDIQTVAKVIKDFFGAQEKLPRKIGFELPPVSSQDLPSARLKIKERKRRIR